MGEAAHRPLVAAVAPREAVDDGQEIPLSVADDFDERMVRIDGVDSDGRASGAAIRDAFLTHPGLYVRFQTEASKRAFLDAKIAVPGPAYLPAGQAPGILVHLLVDFVRLSGFEIDFAKPSVRIGPRHAGSADGPR